MLCLRLRSLTTWGKSVRVLNTCMRRTLFIWVSIIAPCTPATISIIYLDTHTHLRLYGYVHIYVQALKTYLALLVLIPFDTITVSDVCSEIGDSECLVCCSIMLCGVMLLIFFTACTRIQWPLRLFCHLTLGHPTPFLWCYFHPPFFTSCPIQHCHLLWTFVSSCAFMAFMFFFFMPYFCSPPLSSQTHCSVLSSFHQCRIDFLIYTVPSFRPSFLILHLFALIFIPSWLAHYFA